jgi:hypothetical protein
MTRGNLRLVGNLVLLLAAAALPNVALAQEVATTAPSHESTDLEPDAEPEVWSRLLAVYLTAGFGTPVGYGGLELEVSPHPVVAVAVGIGIGSGTATLCPWPGTATGVVCDGPFSDRVQYALMTRLRPLRGETVALLVGAGVSAGGYSWDELNTDGPTHKSADHAVWVNGEVGVEYRAPIGFEARGFAGFAHMLNPGTLECLDIRARHCEEDHQGDGEWLIYLGGSVGWALPL